MHKHMTPCQDLAGAKARLNYWTRQLHKAQRECDPEGVCKAKREIKQAKQDICEAKSAVLAA